MNLETGFLEVMLESLAEDVEFPATPQFTLPTASVPIRRFAVRPWLIAAAIAILLLTATLLNPEARKAVADWFGIGSIRITFVDDLLDRGDSVEIDSSLLLGERNELAALEFPAPILGLPDLEPTAAYQRSEERATMLTLLYPASETLPAIGDTGIGAVLMQIDDPREIFMLVKRARREDGTFVSIGEQEGFWLGSGELSALPFDPGGMFGLPTVSRATGNVLIWQTDGITYRLETSLGKWEASRLAASLVPIEAGTNRDQALYGKADSLDTRKVLPCLAASSPSPLSRSRFVHRRLR